MRRCSLAVGVLLLAVGSQAQVVPLGNEFQVNTFTYYSQDQADVASLSTDGFVVVWSSYEISGPPAAAVRGRRFDAEGIPAGDDFAVVGSAYYHEPAYPAATGTPGGGFLVVWEDDFFFADEDVHLRRFGADGLPLASAVTVNTNVNGAQTRADVSAQSDGDFLVVWQSDYTSGPASNRIKGQFYTANGTPSGAEFHVSEGAEYTYNLRPAIDVFPDDTFLVVWEQAGFSGGSDTEIIGRVLDTTGTPVTPEFQVNSSTIGPQAHPDVAALSSTEAAVVWQSQDAVEFMSENIMGRRVLSSGSTTGIEFEVSQTTTAYHSAQSPAIDAADSSTFVVVWDDNNYYATPGIRARQMHNTGVPVSDSTAVNPGGSGEARPAVAVNSKATGLAVWDATTSTGDDLDPRSIAGRFLVASGIFSDGFESGDTSAWSSALP